jgi:hypothetical protein
MFQNGINSPKAAKEYSPQVRSGPYAILITMAREMENPSYPGQFNSKK